MRRANNNIPMVQKPSEISFGLVLWRAGKLLHTTRD